MLASGKRGAPRDGRAAGERGLHAWEWTAVWRRRTLSLGVQSRHLVVRIEGEPFWLVCPGFADELVRGEATQAPEAAGEVVGGDEVIEMSPEPDNGYVSVSPDLRFLLPA